MRSIRKDAVAAVLLAAVLIPYLGYVIRGTMPLIQDARGMAAVGIVAGGIAFAVLGIDAFGPRWFGIGAGVVAVGLGVTAAVLETGTAALWFLGAFMVVLTALVVTAVVRDVASDRGIRAVGRHV